MLYSLNKLNERSTFIHHLNSFKKYKILNCLYVNVNKKIPKLLFQYEFDLLILHYSFLAGPRLLTENTRWDIKIDGLRRIRTKYKIAIPQDEYLFTDRLYKLFKSIKVDLIATTLISDHDIRKFYLRSNSYKPKIKKVLTGYLYDEMIKKLKNSPKLNERKIDFGYRARKIDFICGEHGDLKYKLKQKLVNYFKFSNYNIDIENTNIINSKKTNVFNGDSWYKFLKSCKFFFGCEGGSSLYDPNGKILELISKYVKENSNPSFEQVKFNCFKLKDNLISNYALGPRNLECIVTKTLQILVEGKYNGVLKPWIHYLPLKKDFSNIDLIIEKTNDLDYCQKMVDNAYLTITNDEKLKYNFFVKSIINEMIVKETSISNKSAFFNSKFLKFKLFFVNNYPRLVGEIRVILKSFLLLFISMKLLDKIKSNLKCVV